MRHIVRGDGAELALADLEDVVRLRDGRGRALAHRQHVVGERATVRVRVLDDVQELNTRHRDREVDATVVIGDGGVVHG